MSEDDKPGKPKAERVVKIPGKNDDAHRIVDIVEESATEYALIRRAADTIKRKAAITPAMGSPPLVKIGGAELEVERNKKVIAYVDHPLGERGESHHHAQNMENAGRWAKWLFMETSMIVLIPWWPMVVMVDEPAYQQRMLLDQIQLIRRCAGVLVQCGGFVSPHMRIHEEHARRRNIPVACLTQYATPTGWGPMPPEPKDPGYYGAFRELNRAIDAAQGV